VANVSSELEASVGLRAPDAVVLPNDPRRQGLRMPPGEWVYIGKPSAWLPCLVVVDWAFQKAPTQASGGRYYYFWIFGYVRLVNQELRWNM
jgi:hypothetical protein